jgi:hypothetical protein
MGPAKGHGQGGSRGGEGSEPPHPHIMIDTASIMMLDVAMLAVLKTWGNETLWDLVELELDLACAANGHGPSCPLLTNALHAPICMAHTRSNAGQHMAVP